MRDIIAKTIRWLLLVSCSCIIARTNILAQEERSAEATQTGAEALASLKAELEKAQKRWLEKYRGATTDEERNELRKREYSPLRLFEPKFLELAKKYATEPTAIDAVQWLADTADPGPVFDAGLALIEQHHIESPRMVQLCEVLVFRTTPGIEPFMLAVAERNPVRDVQGVAYLSLARYFKYLRGLAQVAENPTERFRETYDRHYSEDVRKWVESIDQAALARRIDELCHHVIDEYGDVEHGRRTLADAAKSLLFEMHAVGSVAPEIDGEDIRGEGFKLSDYRGKVVVLDFWGHW